MFGSRQKIQELEHTISQVNQDKMQLSLQLEKTQASLLAANEEAKKSAGQLNAEKAKASVYTLS